MSFVTLGGSGDAPTFFELVASERLMPTLKAAVVYSLSLLAQRRPGLNRLLDHDEELFFLTNVLLDRQSLWHHHASFAESLYSLKRIPKDAASGSTTMSPAQRRLSLIILTLIPYIRAKLLQIYVAAVESDLPLAPPSRRDFTAAPIPASSATDGSNSDQNNNAAALNDENSSSIRQSTAQERLERFQQVVLRVFVKSFPWINASYEGAKFGYQMMYLLGRTPYYSPSLHMLRLVVARVSGKEMVEAENLKQRNRAERSKRVAAGIPLLRSIRRGAVKTGELLADHTRSALILSVFAFKLLEWWYSSAEQKLEGRKGLPPPPPPPSLAPSPAGVGLPKDPSHCPLCRQKRTNPALLVTSGYVFCYPCIHRHLEVDQRCPVTLGPASVDHIRRLYQSV